jgi:hypothetical protein
MGAKNYDWVRYWQQRDGRPVPPATDFLPEVQSDWFFSEDTYRRLSELEHVRCLVLLGEPGMGKTREVAVEVARLEEAGRSVEFHDLKALASADRLERKIFGGEKFQALSGGTSDLTLFLDSIDEGRIVVKAVTDVLAEELSAAIKNDHVRTGLRLRITCRSKDWPDSFGGDLQRIFGEDLVQIWHLRQLRRTDVESAARTEGVDANALIQAIHLRNATALAAKPVTLRMLLGRYRMTGTLPTMQADLYRQGVLELCKEPNEKRVDKDAPEWVGRLTPDQRYAVARRIAGLSILCQRPFVQTRHRAGEPVSEGCLALSDLCGREKVSGTELNVDEAAVTEVLGCALFQGSGPGMVSWSHQTYAEFLAAGWLNSHRPPDRQLSSLIHPPGDSGDRVAPQLREMVAWLVSLDLQLGHSLMEANPDVLMRSDVLAGDEETRCQLAGLFLDSVESGSISGPSQNYPYARLAAEGLGDVLRHYITAKALRFDTRYCALLIAQECSCKSLADDLVAFAMDEGNEPYLRQLALLALREVAVERHLAAIAPLRAHGNEELQAIAIDVLWPGTISTAEALEHLRPTQNRSLIGWRHQLINDDIPKKLPERDLATALGWMAEFVRRHPDASYDSGCRDFAEQAIKLWAQAVPRVSEPEVMEAIWPAAGSVDRLFSL